MRIMIYNEGTFLCKKKQIITLMMRGWLLISSICFCSCSQQVSRSENVRMRKRNVVKENIFRWSKDCMFESVETHVAPLPEYPWRESRHFKHYVPITREFFRCKGNRSNLPRRIPGGREFFVDCLGLEQHGLPYAGGEEFIFPILITLLNYIQETLHSRVVITTGHRCPLHNKYADTSLLNMMSKHQIGAEVDFYVIGFETNYQQVVQRIINFYQKDREKEYRYFSCSLNYFNAWHNKEIMIRVHAREEERDMDNLHPYPYLTLEVLFDRQKETPVMYAENKAQDYIKYTKC